jgi:hypothetical protein
MVLFLPMAAVGQRLEVAPRIGYGVGTQDGLDRDWSAMAGARVHVLWGSWGVYSGIHERAFVIVCFPGECDDRPTHGTELTAGLVRIDAAAQGIHSYLLAGAGIYRWPGAAFFIEAEGGGRLPLATWAGISLGLRGMATPRLPRRRFHDILNLEGVFGGWVTLGNFQKPVLGYRSEHIVPTCALSASKLTRV